MKVHPFRWIAQALLYAAFAATIALFSHWPPYRSLEDGQALLKISFLHHGQRLSACVEQTPEELAKLPPNMRAPVRCPRERSPVTMEVDLGGAPVLRRTANPSGLSRDGASSMYQRVQVPAGEQHLVVRMNDDVRHKGFTHQREATVTLQPAQILVIDFDAEQGGITLR